MDLSFDVGPAHKRGFSRQSNFRAAITTTAIGAKMPENMINFRGNVIHSQAIIFVSGLATGAPTTMRTKLYTTEKTSFASNEQRGLQVRAVSNKVTWWASMM